MNTQQLLVVIPYCLKDVAQAKALLNWIHTISPSLAPHCCLLAADADVPHETKTELGIVARSIFFQAETAIIPMPAGVTGWPLASNAMFQTAARHIRECYKLPWFWMEPDCIPLVPSWLDELALHYSRSPKKMMGAHIRASQPPLPPVHLAGCAIYPNDTQDLLKVAAENNTSAWDMAAAGYSVPRSTDTPLIHHHYGEVALPPIFKETRGPADPLNTCTLDFIRKGAVVFHRCKDGSLIDLLAKQRNSEAVSSAQTSLASTPLGEAIESAPKRSHKKKA